MEENIICIVSKETFGEYDIYDIQTNTLWENNPDEENYVLVPQYMVKDIVATNGVCDITFNEDKTEIISFTPRKNVDIPSPDSIPSAEERLSALEAAMLEMLGVEIND